MTLQFRMGGWRVGKRQWCVRKRTCAEADDVSTITIDVANVPEYSFLITIIPVSFEMQ